MIEQIFPWFLSAITIFYMYLAGIKYRNTWLISFVAQILWVIWIVMVEAWGLIPMQIALLYISIKNHIEWIKE